MSKLSAVKNIILSKLNGPNIVLQNLNSKLTNKSTREFYRLNLSWPYKVATLLEQPLPRYDRFLLSREPKLTFEGYGEERLVKISEIYQLENEVREDSGPYRQFAQSLFNSSVITQSTRKILDVGCTSGNLILEISKLNINLEVRGYEAFNFFKENADKQISEKIEIIDMRKPIEKFNHKSDLVICTEVGEHIDPARIDFFLNNLKNLTSNLLVISWSATFPPPSAPPQHLSVLTTKQLRLLLMNYGFAFMPILTKQLNNEMKKGLNSNHHWLDSLSVWKNID